MLNHIDIKKNNIFGVIKLIKNNICLYILSHIDTKK